MGHDFLQKNWRPLYFKVMLLSVMVGGRIMLKYMIIYIFVSTHYLSILVMYSVVI